MLEVRNVGRILVPTHPLSTVVVAASSPPPTAMIYDRSAASVTERLKSLENLDHRFLRRNSPLPTVERRIAREYEEQIENMVGHLNSHTCRVQTAYYAKVLDKVKGQTGEVIFYQLHSTAFQHSPLGRTMLGPTGGGRPDKYVAIRGRWWIEDGCNEESHSRSIGKRYFSCASGKENEMEMSKLQNSKLEKISKVADKTYRQFRIGREIAVIVLGNIIYYLGKCISYIIEVSLYGVEAQANDVVLKKDVVGRS